MLQYNPTVTGSLQVSGDITGTINGINITGLSQSLSTQLVTVQSSTASSDAKFETLSGVTSSALTRLTNIESKSASVDISISNINFVTTSNIARLSNLETKSSSVDISLSSINSKTGSYATTGSNSFYGTQVFSGSVYIANDLVVQGSSSIQYISASSVSIGTNIVQLNTANPSIRFAGLTIIDSGSIGGSGSFLYDSLQDEFVFVHRGNGSNITSSHFVLGPETYDSLGNETYLTCNVITKGTGKEHLVDSCIFDNGTTVCVNSNLIGTGTISGTTIYGSTAVCSAVGKFTSCIDTCAGYFTGKIGIGTTTPQSTLHIGPSLNSMPAATSIAVPGDTSIRFMAGSDGNANYGSFIAGTQVSGVRALSLGSRQGEGDIVTMTLTQGNVGIGAISPNAPLHICNTCTITNMSIQNVNCSGYALYQAKSACTVYTWQWGSWNDGTYRIGQSGVGDYMTIATSGNVGIGTTTPQKPLELRTGGTSTTPAQIFFGGISQAIVGGETQIAFSSNISPSAGNTTTTELARAGIGFQYVSAAQPSEFSIGIQCTNVCNSNLKIWNNAARLTISSTGISTFACQICTPTVYSSSDSYFCGSTYGIMGLGAKVHEGTYNVYTGPSCVLTLPINYGSASSIYLFGTLLGNDSMHYAHMMYYYRNDFAGFVGSTINQMSCHNVSTAGQRYTFSVVDPGGLGKSGCLLQINITCANGPSVGAGSYYTRFKIVVYNI